MLQVMQQYCERLWIEQTTGKFPELIKALYQLKKKKEKDSENFFHFELCH